MAERHDLAARSFQKGLDALRMAYTSDSHSEFQFDMREALEAFSQAAALDPEYADAWFQKGSAASSLERYQEAEGAFRQAVRLRPDDSSGWMQLGDVLRALEDHQEALLAYQEVLRLRPADANARFQRGVMLRALGRHEEALAVWDELLSSASGDTRDQITDARVFRAQALAARGSAPEARDAFREAFRLGWEYARGGFTRWTVLDSLRRFQEARDAYQEEVRARPEGAEWKLAGDTFIQADRPAEALAAYDAAITERPEDPDAWKGFAEALVQAGRRAEAVPAYEQALRLDPTHHSEARLGVVLRELGRWDELRLLSRERQRTPVVHRPVEPWPVVTKVQPIAHGRARPFLMQFECAWCHAPAGSVRLENDVVTIRGYAVRRPGDDSVQLTVTPADRPLLLRALRAETAQELFDIDERYAPSYCSQCRKVYCLEHWTPEESYPPGMYHKCPSDHIRSLYAV